MEDFEITKGELLLSFLILAIMVGIGIWAYNPIRAKSQQKALEVISATRVTSGHNFDYIRRTNAGRFLAEGELIANDTLRNPDIPGIYSRIYRVTEEYRMHTETYTTTDEKGHTHTHTRTYWSWDAVGYDDDVSRSFTFLGKRFTAKEINYGVGTDKSTIVKDKKKRDRRYVYHTTPITVTGVLDGTADNKAYENLNFMRGKTIDQVVERAEKNMKTGPIVFWILWGFLTGFVLFVFFALENRWLEYDN